jgi:transposase
MALRLALGFARWLRMRGVEAYVIHLTSIAVSSEHQRAKTDRLDAELLLCAPSLAGCA